MVLAAFVGAGFYFGPVVANFQPAEAGVAKKLLRAHNKERAKRNRPRLKRHGALNRSSRKYANVMAANSHFSHVGPAPEFSEFFERIRAEGFNGSMAENIARGQQSVKEVMRGWMRSSGHRKNILSRKYKYFGGANASGPGGPYWVGNFGG